MLGGRAAGPLDGEIAKTCREQASDATVLPHAKSPWKYKSPSEPAISMSYGTGMTPYPRKDVVLRQRS
jgi:hypothetical protein